MDWSFALQGLTWGLLSAASLPLGAALGLWGKPSRRLTSALMAFGGGALLFALAIELFGHALHAASDGEGRIELDKNGILTITGEEGEGMLRIDTNSGIAKTIITFIERMFETAIVEMERELESVR